MDIISQKEINRAVAIIKKGGVVVYPTDTAYALGGFFDSPKTAAKILKIKERQDEKFTLIAASAAQVRKYFKLSPAENKLARKYWPGPLSLVVSDRFAVRVPDNALARQLAAKAGRPLIATSANISGTETLYGARPIIEQFKDKKNQPDLIIDAGPLKKIKTSTIVKVVGDILEVLRAGAIKL
jgi:L-threonylcarbamoyladenylate synthase